MPEAMSNGIMGVIEITHSSCPQGLPSRGSAGRGPSAVISIGNQLFGC